VSSIIKNKHYINEIGLWEGPTKEHDFDTTRAYQQKKPTHTKYFYEHLNTGYVTVSIQLKTHKCMKKT